jgi:hypothetical protein
MSMKKSKPTKHPMTKAGAQARERDIKRQQAAQRKIQKNYMRKPK